MSETKTDPLKENLNVFWSNVKSMTKGGLAKSKVASKKVTHKVKRSLLYHDRNKLFQELGESAFRLMEKGALEAAELRHICDRIEKINQMIRSQSTALDELK